MAPILSVKNLTVRLDGRPIFHDLHFELSKGETLAVIGPNGSGKTVLLRTLLGLERHEGTITWEKNARIAYVPQKIDADRHLPLTITNLLAAKTAIMKLPASEAARVSETVGLTPEILSTPVGHLSGGQFQRALIALALLGDPDAILFDEPTASIDRAGEEQVYELMHRLQDTCGIALIVVSHDLSFVYQHATTVFCLNQSGVCYGSPEETLTSDVLKKLYGKETAVYHHGHV